MRIIQAHKKVRQILTSHHGSCKEQQVAPFYNPDVPLKKNMIVRLSELKVTPFIAPSINTAFNDASAGENPTKKAMCQLQLWEH